MRQNFSECPSQQCNSSVPSDDEGWLDVLGSGRLKKRTVVEGDTSAAKPRNGQKVTIHKKGEMIQIFKSVTSKAINFF